MHPSENAVKPTLALTGIGLRMPHIKEFLQKRPGVAWVEVHSENYMAEGGLAISQLEQVREHYPVSLHGVGLSLGSADNLNWAHLKKLRELIKRIDPCLISEHVSWSSIDGQYLHDLLPLPYTDEAVQHISERIQQVQDYLGHPLLIENISSYIQFTHSTLTEPQFINAIVEKTGCHILLDINNIYVTSMNLNLNPQTYLQAISKQHVHELHLAGFTSMTINNKEVLIDSHNKAVVPAVWDLYRAAIMQFGTKPTIIEWDDNLPTLDTLYLEAFRAEKIMRDIYVTAKRTA